MLSLVPPPAIPDIPAPAVAGGEPGLADVLTLGGRRPVAGLADDESLFFTDTLAEHGQVVSVVRGGLQAVR
jgi:hypothetical protein